MSSSKRSYDEAHLAEAVRLVQSEGYSYERAGRAMGVPRNTVHRRSTATDHNGQWRVGAPTALPVDAEDELAREAVRSRQGNVLWDRHDLMVAAADIAQHRNICTPPNFPTHRWVSGFIRRHAGVAERKPRTTSAAHAQPVPHEVVDTFFKNVAAVIAQHNLSKEAIWNMDESGLRLSPAQPRVLCDAAGDQPMTTRGRNSPFVTVIGCASAAGATMPPAILFRSTVNVDFARAAGAGTAFCATAKGQSTRESFNMWVDHFLKHAPPLRPLLLLIDNHASRASPAALRKLSNASVILMGLPANTSPLLQALDVGLWKPMKLKYRRALHDLDLRDDNPAPSEMTKYGCSFKAAWEGAATVDTIKAAWSGAGFAALPPTVDQLAHKNHVAPAVPPPPPAALQHAPAPGPPPLGFRAGACPSCGRKPRARAATVPPEPGFYTAPTFIDKLEREAATKAAKRQRKH